MSTMFLDEFPQELSRPIKALADTTRQRLILLLQEKETLAYSEIMENTRLLKGNLNHHLNVLMKSGLIRNFGKDEPGTPFTSYYAISDFGKRVLESLRNILRPQQVVAEIAMMTTTNCVAKIYSPSEPSRGREIVYETARQV